MNNNDEFLLPKWLKKLRAIAKYLSPGFIMVISGLIFVPQVKKELDFNFPVLDGYINFYKLLIAIVVILAIPCFVLSGTDWTKIIKK